MSNTGHDQSKELNAYGVKSRARIMRQVLEKTPSRANLFRKVYDNEVSPRMAIKAKCLECLGWSEGEIRECSAPACQLWSFRPFQRPARRPSKPEAKQGDGA